MQEKSSINHTYEHHVGCLLEIINIIASKLKLTAAEYRILINMITLVNSNEIISEEYLSIQCNMSIKEAFKYLKKLENRQLIIKKLSNGKNDYSLSEKVLNY